VGGLRALEVDQMVSSYATDRAEDSILGTTGAAAEALGLLLCSRYLPHDALALRALDSLGAESLVAAGVCHDSLCDGTLGNLDIALAVAQRRSDGRDADAS